MATSLRPLTTAAASASTIARALRAEAGCFAPRTCLMQRQQRLPPRQHFSHSSRRRFRSAVPEANHQSRIPDFAFAFDIDGVLLHSSTPISGAIETLSYLQSLRIPFILLTNGGGRSEAARIADLQAKLAPIKLDNDLLVQSHTPFAGYTQYHDKTVLVVGGDAGKCRAVAEEYGFGTVVTPGDLVVAEPEIWPFAKVFADYYKGFAQPLPKPIAKNISPKTLGPDGLRSTLKIDAIFVYSDPRDWGLDATVILDTLLSHKGHIGTLSPLNANPSLPNSGYQQDSQPPLYFSNPDLWWSSAYHANRLGQGGFRAALDGLWNTVTSTALSTSASPNAPSAKLAYTVLGKPSQETYAFAEDRLRAHRKALFGHVGLNDPLRRVYMIGDNPESDIAGANGYVSAHGSSWTSVLVKTGVWREGVERRFEPKAIKADVQEAVRWAVEEEERWQG